MAVGLGWDLHHLTRAVFDKVFAVCFAEESDGFISRTMAGSHFLYAQPLEIADDLLDPHFTRSPQMEAT